MTSIRPARLLALAMFASIMLTLTFSGAASAASCDDYWVGPSGGQWLTASNWSSGTVPGSGTNVCLDHSYVAGAYTVVAQSGFSGNAPIEANSITVGGSSGPLITLQNFGTPAYTHGSITLTNQSAGDGVTTNGEIDLGSTNGISTGGTHGGIGITAGTLVNDGTIVSENTNDETQNYINGDFDNAGTLSIQNNFTGTVGSWTNSGTIAVNSGQSVALSSASTASSFTQTGGTISNAGSFTLSDGAFVGTAGTSTGNPLIVTSDNAGVDVDVAGTGSDFLHLMTGGANLTGNIGPGYTVWSSGQPGYSHGNLTTQGSFTNYGTLELGSIDGTHGTLTVPSGSFTNDGTLTFMNTANGPDGLDGNLVNNGTVTVPNNSVQGSGVITNNGTFALSAGATFAATSYAQGAGGTLALAITGGGSPAVPALQLSGGAALGGTLTTSTTGGTAAGTFPVVTASPRSGSFGATHFTGENYALDYSSSGLSLTWPASPSTSPSTAQVGSVTGGAGKLTVKVSCPAGGGSCASVTITATVTEHLKGGKLIAVTASKHKVKTKHVVIARTTVSLAAGASRPVKLKLNGTGQALLKKRGTLATVVTVTSGGRTIKKATVRVHKPKKQHGK